MRVDVVSEAAAAGLSVRPGRAVVVVLRGSRRAPEIVVRYEIQLADPWMPESLHPYHQELGAAGAAFAVQARRRGCRAAQKATSRAIRTLVRDMKSHRLTPCGACVVVSSLVDPEQVVRAHPRAHAREEKLYREAVEIALGVCGVPFVTIEEKHIRAVAAERLGRTARQMETTLKALSHEVGTPWRAPEKRATLGAWLMLTQPAGAP